MTSILSGNGLGLFNTSLNLLGAGFGSAQLGRQGERVYVNNVTGNLVLQNQDELLVGLGLDASLVRTYNSQGLLNDDNGDNWRLNIAALFNIPGTPNSVGSSVSKRFGDGAEVIYTYDSTVGSATYGKYVSTAGDGAHDTILYSGGATPTWTWTDGSSRTTETYNSAGQLSVARDIDGNPTFYTYVNGLLAQIDDASGQQHVFLDYSGTNLTQIRTVTTGGEQTRVRYTYDAQNRLSQVIVDLTVENNAASLVDSNSDQLFETVNGQTYVTTYTYDGSSKRVASITQGDGTAVNDTSVFFTYLLDGSQWKVSSIRDGESSVPTTFQYLSSTQTRVDDALGHATTYTTDSVGKLIQVTSPTGIVTSYGYDAGDNVISISDGNGNLVAMEYDVSGNLTLTRDVLGNTIKRTYNVNNQLVIETTYLVPDPDGPGVLLPSAPLTTRYVYDSESRLRFVVSAEGKVGEYRYNANGTRSSAIVYNSGKYLVGALSETALLGESDLTNWIAQQGDLTNKLERTDYAYDTRGQLSVVTTYSQTDSSGIGAGAPSVMHYVYDQRGQLLQTLDARNNSAPDANNPALANATTYTYDGLGRIKSATQWIATDVVPRINAYVYDDANRATKLTLANGLSTTSTYDKRGLLVNVLDSNNITQQGLGNTTYKYDAAGNLRIRIDPTGLKIYFLYDSNDRQVAVIDATGAVVETSYDNVGNISRTKAYATRLDASHLANLVDNNGNPVTGITLDSPLLALQSDSQNDRTSYRLYDAANRLVYVLERTDDASVTQVFVTRMFYDGAGRVVKGVRYATPIDLPSPLTSANVTVPTSASDRQTRSFYDGDGKLVGSLDAEGYLTENGYNAAGELTDIIRYSTVATVNLDTSTFDALKNNVGVAARHDYRFYNGKGQLVGVLDADNFLTEYDYDAAGNRTQSTRYARHANGFSGTPALSGVRPNVGSNDQITITAYNGANQVTEVTTNPAGTLTKYFYDNVGNLTQTESGWTSSSANEVRTRVAVYDIQGRLTNELTAEGKAALDAFGPNPTPQQIDQVWADFSVKYTYDSANRKTSTIDQLGHKTLFYYDDAGRLRYTLASADNGTTIISRSEVTETIYNAFGQVRETVRYNNRIDNTGLAGGLVSGDGTFTARLALAVDVANDSHATTNFTLRGAVKSATDAMGAITQYTYNRFGELGSKSDPIRPGVTTLSTYTYDRRGLLLSQTKDADQAGYTGIKRTTSMTYDAFGRVKTSTDANGNPSVVYVYSVGDNSDDRIGRVVTVTDSLGGLRVSAYDAFDRVLRTTDALGYTTTYQYDDTARTFTVTTAEGIRAITRANRHGETVEMEVQTASGARVRLTTYAYDKNGNLTNTTDAVGELNLSTNYEYDRASRKILTRDARGVYTKFEYDAANRLLVRTVDPTTIHASNDNAQGLNLSTRYSYDGQGRATMSTDANGVVTQTLYARNGQVIETIVDPTSVNPTGLNLRTTYTYDAQGRTLVTTEGANTVDARATKYVYDNLGRRTEMHVDPKTITSVNDNPNGLDITTTYVYDANNNLVAKAEGAGTIEARTTRYVYDAGDRLIYTVNAVGAVTKNDYDLQNNLVSSTRYAGTIALDGFGNVITSTDITSLLTTNSLLDQITQYAYDGDGRLTFTVDALRFLTERQYDALGHVVRETRYAKSLPGSIAVTVGSIHNQFLAITGNVDPANDRTTRNVFDAAGRARYAIDALGFVKESVYDNVGNVTQTLEYPQAVSVSPTPTVAEMIAALAGFAANVTTVNSSTTVYTVPPAQPYPYVASANSDVASPATQSVNLQTSNTTTLPSSNLVNNAWVASGTTLVSTTGLALTPGSVGFGDTTPTQVKATIYRADGTLVGTVYTDVGSIVTEQQQRVWDSDVASHWEVVSPGTLTSAVDPVSGSALVTPLSLDVDTSSATWINPSPYVTGGWSGSSSVNLKWTSLDQWGSGSVRLVVNYTKRNSSGSTQAATYDQTLTSAATVSGYAISWSASNSANGGEYAGLASIQRVQVFKNVNGVDVLVYDVTGDTYAGAALTWPKATTANTVATIRYRAVGATTWTYQATTSDNSLQTRGSQYWLDLSARPSDVYEYEVTYSAGGAPYAQGTGTFRATGSSVSGSRNVAGFVEKRSTTISTTSATWTPPAPYVVSGWSGTSSFNISWASIAPWGADPVRVVVNYTKRNGSGGTQAATYDQTFSNPADLITGGVGISWSAVSSANSAEYAGLASVSRVQVMKNINGTWVTISDVTGSTAGTERLVLRGNTSGLTSVVIKNLAGATITTRTATLLASGVYVVDINDLTAGSYTYTPVGTANAVAVRFEAKSTQSPPASPISSESLLQYRWVPVTNWNGQANLTTTTLPPGVYTVVLETRDDIATNTGINGSTYDTDGTWAYNNTVSINVGTTTSSTVSWAQSTQPAGTTVSFQYRAAGSTGSYTPATVSVNGANHQVMLAGLVAGNYEYFVSYTDSYGRIVKSANGTFTNTANQITNVTAVFNYTQVTSTNSAGSSIRNYIAAGEVAAIDYIDAVVTDRTSGATVSTALTYPEFESNYQGEVNLKVGSVLVDGSYNVQITIHRKDGTVDARPVFIYEVGMQPMLQRTTTVTWDGTSQPPNTTAQFSYAPIGSSNFVSAVVDRIGNDNRVSLLDLVSGTYVYTVRYVDSNTGELQYIGTNQFVATANGVQVGVLELSTPQLENTHRTAYVYDKANRLTDVVRGQGSVDQYSESYAYDYVGNLIRHTDGRGFNEYFAYDNANRKIRQIDNAGFATYFSYDAVNNLRSQTTYMNAVVLPSTPDDHWAYAGHAQNPLANTDAVSGDRFVGYVYDKAARLSRKTNPGIDGQSGVVTHYIYDAVNNLTDTVDAEGLSVQRTIHRTYDLAGRITAETTAYGAPEAATSQFLYDAFGNQYQIVDPRGVELAEKDTVWAVNERQRLGYAASAATLTNTQRTILRARYATTQEFDRLNRKTAAANTLGGRTDTFYNIFGDIVKVIDPNRNAGYFFFDSKGQSTFSIDPAGYATQTIYDAFGNAEETIKYANKIQGTYNEMVRPEILADAPSGTPPPAYLVLDSVKDQHTVAYYDVLNRTVRITDAELHSEVFTYDAQDNVATLRDKNSYVTKYDYDAKGNKIAEYLPITGANAQGQQITVVNRNEYDACGNLIKTIEAQGLPEQRVTDHVYDKNNREVRVLSDVVSIINQVTDTNFFGRPTQIRDYDSLGNLIREIDANGNVNRYYYDSSNRRIGFVDAERYLHLYVLDAVGNMTAERTYASVIPAEFDLTTFPDLQAIQDFDVSDYREIQYVYDDLNRLTATHSQQVTLFDRTNGLRTGTIDTQLQYDANGHVVLAIDGNGNRTHYFYDKIGNKISQVDALRYLTAWTYDANGNAISCVHYASALDGPIGIASDPAVLLAEASGHNNPDDRIEIRAFDRMNRKTIETVIDLAYSTVSEAGVLGSQSGSVSTQYVYDGVGNIKTLIRANGGVEDYDYDGVNRRYRVREASFADYQGQAVRTATTTQYDGLGNVRVETREGLSLADNQIHEYFYDAAGRLIRETKPENAEIRYDRDANGNIVVQRESRHDADGVVTPIRTDYRYDKLNRRISTTDAVGLRNEVAYNSNGEIVFKGINNGNQEYFEYDRAGRLVKTNKDDGVDKAFLYDAYGNETAKIQSGLADVELRSMSVSQIAALNPSMIQRTESLYSARNELINTFEATSDFVSDDIQLQPIWVENVNDPFVSGSVIAGGGGNLRFEKVVNQYGVASYTVSWPTIAGYPAGSGYRIGVRTGTDASTVYHQNSDSIYYPNSTGNSAVNVQFSPNMLYTVSLYLETNFGDVLVARVYGEVSSFSDRSIDIPGVIAITGQQPEAQTIQLWLWRNDGTKPTTPLTVGKLTTVQGNAIDGHFVFNNIPSGDYQYEYKVLNDKGWELDTVKGSLSINSGAGWQAADIEPVNHPSSTNPSSPSYAVYMDNNGVQREIWTERAADNTYQILTAVRDANYWSWQNPEIISNGELSAPKVTYSTNTSGRSIATWYRVSAGVATIYASIKLPGQVWSTPEAIGTTPAANTFSGSPFQVGVDGSGNITALWLDSNQNSTIRQYLSGQGWQAPQTFTGLTAGHLEMNASGRVLIWGATQFKTYSLASGWQSVQTIPSDVRPGATLTQDANGNIWAVWTYDNNGVYARRFVLGSGWQSTIQIGTKYSAWSNYYDFQIAVAANGNMLAVWTRKDSASHSAVMESPDWSEHVYSNYYVAGQGWQGEKLLNCADGATNDPYRYSSSLSVGIDNDGNATVVWKEGRNSNYEDDYENWDIIENRYVVGSGWLGQNVLELAPGRGKAFIRVAGNGEAVLGYEKWTFDSTNSWQYNGYVTRRYSKYYPSFGLPSVYSQQQRQLVPVVTGSNNVGYTISHSQEYNAFGEVISETDGRGYETDYLYNRRGQLVQKLDSSTNATSGNGLVVNQRPITHYYYDILGRTVGTDDANGYRTTQRYDNAGHLIGEYHPDGGVRERGYDVFGDLRFLEDEYNVRISYSYDKRNRMTRIDRATDASFNSVQRFETFEYDEGDHQIAHVNLRGDRERNYYDATGRLTRNVSPQVGTEVWTGIGKYVVTTYDYIVGANGEMTTRMTSGDSRSSQETHDYFGRIIESTDLGNRTYRYFYNEAGWLIYQIGNTDPSLASLSSPLSLAGLTFDPRTYASDAVFRSAHSELEQFIKFEYHRNGNVSQVRDFGLNTISRYEYDQNGNRTFEGYAFVDPYTSNVLYYQWADVTYDELNRVTQITDPRYSVAYTYDLVGNRRRVYAQYNDGAGGSLQTQDYWYLYDSMNRFVVTKGQFVGTPGSGSIIAGSEGVALSYDVGGRRRAANTESYEYNVDGLLTIARVDGVRRAERKYDAVGNVVNYYEYGANGTTQTYSSTSTYRADGRINTENDGQATSTYSYDDAGNLTKIYADYPGQNSTDLTTTYVYQYWDGAKQSEIHLQASNENAPGWKPGMSRFVYDVNGHLTRVSDVVADRHLSYQLNHEGLIMQRNELIGSRSSRTQWYYYLNGVGIGDAGMYGTSRTDYVTLLAARDLKGSHELRHVSSADFDYNYQPINESYPAKTPGTYTVRSGDTLLSIALAIWGDSSQWYLIADANGISDTTPLVSGRVLTIPNVVANVHNSASTFRVYSPGEIIGDTTPTLPQAPPSPGPSNKEMCRFVIVMIVAVIVTILTEGATSEYFAGVLGEFWGGVATAAVSAAAGSAASQAVAVHYGLQDEIDWSAVGASALTAGITQGIVSEFNLGGVSGALTKNVVGQGVDIILGRQDRFNWRSLAITAITAPIDQEIEGPTNGGYTTTPTWEGFVGDLATGFMRSSLNAAVTNLVNRGGSLSWANIVGDTLGSAVGNSLDATFNADGRASRYARRVNKATIDDFQARGIPYSVGLNGNPIPMALPALQASTGPSLDLPDYAQFDTESLDKHFSLLDTTAPALEGPGILDKALGLLQKGVQALTSVAIGAKELAFGVLKLPFDFVGGVAEAVSNHLTGRLPEGNKGFLYDFIDNPMTAMSRSFSQTMESATWGFTHFGDEGGSLGASLGRFVNAVPVIGRFLNGGASSTASDGPARTFYAPGINQLPDEVANNEAAGAMVRARGAPASITVPYVDGTFADTLFGFLNLNNGASAHFANEVRSALSREGLGETTVNIFSHSGGVQIAAGATTYLGDISIAVDHLIGAEGPTMGRYNNAGSITLMGNAAIGSDYDFISGMGAWSGHAVFGNNVATDFAMTLPDNYPSHISPSAKYDYYINQANRILNGNK